MNEFNVVGLYEHNATSYRKTREAFTKDDVVGIVHGTGTGKTYNGYQLAYDNKNLKILWLVPSNAIIEHLKRVIDDNPNLDMERDFSHVEFRTYQSLINMSRRELEALDVDLLILDEFHHIGAPVWGARVNTIIETHPNLKIFGMTAYTVRDRGASYERDMANPDGNELFSNKIVSRYDLCDAMIDGVLPKPIYRSAYINLLGMEQQLEERVKKLNASSREYQEYMSILSSARKRIAEAPGVADVVKKHVKPNGKYIYFCPPFSEDGVNDIETIKKEAMEWFKDYVPEEDIVFYTSTSDMKDSGKSNREAFYNDVDLDGNNVDGKLRIMFAINQYNEGVHAPNIDGVIMGRGTTSDIVFFEQLGRGLSVRGDTFKKFNEYSNYSIEQLRDLCIKRDINITADMAKEEIIERLIAPVIIDLAGNISFIKTLENNLRDRIKDIQTSETGAKREIKIRDASFDIDIVNEDLFNILECLRDRLTFTWNDYYELAKEYYKEHGNLEIPISFKTLNGYEYNENGVNLGSWIRVQRRSYKNRSLSKEERNGTTAPLTDEQVKLLEDIGMLWEPYAERWNKMYKLAKEYYKEHGNLEIPDKFKTLNGYEYNELGVNLGPWIRTQRISYKNRSLSKVERKSTSAPLTDEQVKLLEDIGMLWDAHKENWMRMYKLAQEYYREYGNLEIPARFKTINGYEYNDLGVNLGIWIRNQREAYKNRNLSKEEWKTNKVTLTDEQVKLLEDIGMLWYVYSENWMRMYKLSQEYYREYGNLEIPVRFKTINGYEYNDLGVNLGIWINNQRKAYKNRCLSKEERKSANAPLTDEQVRLLETIDMGWDAYTENWMRMYKLAQEYYREYGNLQIPRNFKTINGYEYNDLGFNLGKWIHYQRDAYKNRSLSKEERKGNTAPLTDEQVRLLESIGMIWDVRKNKSDVLELCNDNGIDIKKNKDIISHISYTEFKVKISYLKDNDMPIESDGVLHEIFSMSSMNIILKYNVSLEDLVNIYMKGRSL